MEITSPSLKSLKPPTTERPKSQDETDSSTYVTSEWQNSPIARAVTQKNSAGKLVCPFSTCRKQHVSDLQLGKNLLKDHHKDLSMKDRKNIMEFTSTPLRSLKSSSPEVSPVKIQSEGSKKKSATISPVQTR